MTKEQIINRLRNKCSFTATDVPKKPVKYLHLEFKVEVTLFAAENLYSNDTLFRESCIRSMLSTLVSELYDEAGAEVTKALKTIQGAPYHCDIEEENQAWRTLLDAIYLSPKIKD